MIMILRYMALIGDFGIPHRWDSMYAGEFATVEAAIHSVKEQMLHDDEDYWEVVDLMTKKVVAEGNRKEALREKAR